MERKKFKCRNCEEGGHFSVDCPTLSNNREELERKQQQQQWQHEFYEIRQQVKESVKVYAQRFKGLIERIEEDIPEIGKVITFTRGLLPAIYLIAVMGNQNSLNEAIESAKDAEINVDYEIENVIRTLGENKNDEEEIKREIIEHYLNYRKILEAITKGNSTVKFILEKELKGSKYWEIQTFNGTRKDGIILLKSTLGEFYINRDQKKGKIQYLNMKKEEKRENHEKDLIDQIKELKEEVQEMRQERDKDIGELTEWMKKINGNMRKLIDQMEKIIVENLIEQSEKNMAILQKESNDRKRNNSERNEKRSCYHCGKEGHVRPFCPELRRN